MAYCNYKHVRDLLIKSGVLDKSCEPVDGKYPDYDGTHDYNSELWVMAADEITRLNERVKQLEQANEWVSVDIEPDYVGLSNCKHVAIINDVGWWVTVFWNMATKEWIDEYHQPIEILFYKYIESKPITKPIEG